MINSLEAALRRSLMGWGVETTQRTAAATVSWWEVTNEVTTPGSSNYNITLPPLAEGKGLTYSFKALNTGGGTATVVPGADAPALTVTPALKAAGDFVNLTSDGRRWIVLDSDITA